MIKSSTFAEYVVLSEAVTEILFVKNICNEAFNLKISSPIKVYEDNSRAVAIAKFRNFTKNSKHIEIQFHYVNEHSQNGVIDIVKVSSGDNMADIFTKELDKQTFLKNRMNINLN